MTTPADSYFIGLRSKKASSWLGLSDARSEQDWRWTASPTVDEGASGRDSSAFELMRRITAKKASGMKVPSPREYQNPTIRQSTKEWRSSAAGRQEETPVRFSSWAINQPTGDGDAAILYPYHWSFGDCEEHKR